VRDLEALVVSRESQIEKLSATAGAAMNEADALRSSLTVRSTAFSEAEEGWREELEREREIARTAAGASKEVARLTQRCSTLEASLEEAEKRAAETLEEGEALARKVGTLEGTLKSTRERVRAVEQDRDARKEELAVAEGEIGRLKARLDALEVGLEASRAEADSTSHSAVENAGRVAALVEEVSTLRAEAKARAKALSDSARESEAAKATAVKALADNEALENAREESEAALQAARTAEAAAARLAGSLEDSLREARRALSAAQAGAGAREDYLRSQLEAMTEKWQRAVTEAEDGGLSALAAAYGVTISGERALGKTVAATVGDAVAVAGEGRSASAGDGGVAPPSTSLAQALVSQLSALQTELASKRESWVATRSTLQARLSAAEAALERSEGEARAASGAAADAQASASALRVELITLRGSKARSEAELGMLMERAREAEGRLAVLSGAHDAACKERDETKLALVDLKSKLDEAVGARAAAGHMAGVLRDQLGALQEEAGLARREAAAARRAAAEMNNTNINSSSGGNNLQYHGGSGVGSNGGDIGGGEDSGGGISVSTAAWLQMTLGGGGEDGGLRTNTPGAGSPSPSHVFSHHNFSGGGGVGSKGGLDVTSPVSALHGVLAQLESERDALAERAVELSGKLSALEGMEANALGELFVYVLLLGFFVLRATATVDLARLSSSPSFPRTHPLFTLFSYPPPLPSLLQKLSAWKRTPY